MQLTVGYHLDKHKFISKIIKAMVAILPRNREVVALLPAFISNVLAVATYAYSRSSWEVDKRNEAAKANPIGSCEHFCDFQRPLYTDAAHTFSCHGNPRWVSGDVRYCKAMCQKCREVCSYEDRFKCPRKGNFNGPYEPELPDDEHRPGPKDTSKDKKEETNVLVYVAYGVGGLLLLGIIILCFVCIFCKSSNRQAASNQPVMMQQQQQQPNYSPQQQGGNGNQGAMQRQPQTYPSQNIPPYSYQTGNAFDYVYGGQNQPSVSGIVQYPYLQQ